MIETEIKGYTVPYGYRGYADGKYLLFATDEEYEEYVAEESRHSGEKWSPE